MTDTQIAIFRNRKIRKQDLNGEWWFSVVDVVEALTDSNKPRVYWNAMKKRVKLTDGIELSTICRQLKLMSSDGKKYLTDCSNTEGILRIIQSIPSPKVEPIKDGLQELGLKEYKKLKILNLRLKELVFYTNLKDTQILGLKREYVELRSERN